MKRYRIKYKSDYFAKRWRFMTVIAETPQDANNFFFENHSGVIFETKFIGWA